MDIGRLKQRIDNLRQPIIKWLDFYKIENLEDKTDHELTTMLINKITNYREYGYIQNREFEELLQVPLTNENEERNKINWNIIVDIYKIHMKETIERLGKTFEDLGYRQQWQALSSQAIIIATKTLQIRAILTQTIQPNVHDPTVMGIMDMLIEIEKHLRFANEVYDIMIDRQLNIVSTKPLKLMDHKLIDIDNYVLTLEQKFTETEQFVMKGFEIIQNQENEIQQAKDAIIPALNQISPITEINGLNESSIIEINQVARDLLLEQSKTIKHLQNVINTQQIQITNLQNENENTNYQQQIQQWKYTAYYIAQLQFATCREC
jgi:hypothetical protein